MRETHRPVSPQPPRVFRISFYTFLLNDFSPLSWSWNRIPDTSAYHKIQERLLSLLYHGNEQLLQFTRCRHNVSFSLTHRPPSLGFLKIASSSNQFETFPNVQRTRPTRRSKALLIISIPKTLCHTNGFFFHLFLRHFIANRVSDYEPIFCWVEFQFGARKHQTGFHYSIFVLC